MSKRVPATSRFAHLQPWRGPPIGSPSSRFAHLTGHPRNEAAIAQGRAEDVAVLAALREDYRRRVSARARRAAIREVAPAPPSALSRAKAIAARIVNAGVKRRGE